MPTTTLLAASDAMVSSSFPTKNYAGLAWLQLNSSPSDRVGYVYFNQPFPLGVTILSATLTGKQRGAAVGGSRTLSVRRAATSWAESKIVSGGRPTATGATAARTLGDSAVDGRPWVWDVKAAMQEVSDGAAWFGFRIDSNNATIIKLHSRESDIDDPWTLEVQWSDAPAPPSRLSPSAGRSISVARPTLRFDFADVSGDTSMGGFQVEVSTSTSFTSPAFASGAVDSDVPQWTLGGDLTTGVTYYWRVQVKDAAGVWSGWSDTASFKRTAKPVVTITSPAASPANIVYTPTPTFSWTVAGQKAYQLFLVDPADETRVLWSSDKVDSTVTSYTLPVSENLLLTNGQSYRLIVRVWDAVARESIPEENVYIDTARTFSFGTSSSTTGVTGVVAVPDAELPFVTVSWSRASAPDEGFPIMVNGAPFTVVDAADASTGGTGYSYELRGLTPDAEATIGVAAQDSGAMSAISTTQATPTGTGFWLYSLEPDGPVVPIKVREDGSVRPVSEDPSEATAIFRSAGAHFPAMVSSVVRTPEGGGAGWLDVSDLPDWLAITSPRVSTIGMLVVRTVKRVQVYNVVTGYADEQWSDTLPVQFDYIEVG